MTRPEKTNRELDVFRAFASSCPLNIDASSIQKMDPPEPDIRCETVGGDAIAFEITEIVDSEMMQKINVQCITKRELYAFPLALPDSGLQFQERYRRASISLDFSGSSTLNQRKAIFPKLFDILLSARSSFSEFTVKNDPDLLPVLRKIRVTKTNINGPSFHVDGYGYLSDPTGGAISKKLQSTYHTPYPMELLAYVERDLLPSREDCIRHASEVCAGGLGSFRRVWIYDLIADEIQFVYPPI